MGNCAGIDWASEKHDVLIEDPAGEELLGATFAHDEDGVSGLCAALACYAFACGEQQVKARELLRDIVIPGLRAASPWDYNVAPAVAYAAAAVWELRDSSTSRSRSAYRRCCHSSSRMQCRTSRTG